MQHSMVLIGSGMSKWVPPSSLTAWSARSCIQLRNGIEGCVGRLDVGGAGELVRDGPLLILDSAKFLEPPSVGLLEIDNSAQEVARIERIALLPDRVQARRQRCQLSCQPNCEVTEGRSPLVTRGSEVGKQRIGQVGGSPRYQFRKEIVAPSLTGP